MNTPKNPAVIADDVVVSLDYTLTVESEIVDTSEGSDPIEFLQGRGQIIVGLERALYGMKVGDTKSVTINPTDGYGEVDEEAFIEVSRSEFPKDIPATVGTAIQMQDEHGEIMDARISEVSKDMITLDFNHPLAGKTLHFDVSVVDLRNPTEEELAHGHVHFEDFDEDEEFENDEYDDELEEDEDLDFDDEGDDLEDEEEEK